jgi:hypothetical protein
MVILTNLRISKLLSNLAISNQCECGYKAAQFSSRDIPAAESVHGDRYEEERGGEQAI